MIQCFVKKEYAPPFGLAQPPRLFSVSRTDEKASAHPRVMHAHDDLVEVVLVRGGESRYFVGGLPYQARRGDLFVFNSRVVHDEPSGPDRPVATSSLALGGLQVPGLRENALIPEDALPVCHLTEPQTVRLERLYDVLYDELTAGNDDGAHHLLMAILTLVQQFRAAAADGYFTGVISGFTSPILWFLVYLAATTVVVYNGVEKGIEKISKILMPVLLFLILGIAVFSLTLQHTDGGVTRTGLQGLLVYVVPDFSGMTFSGFMTVLMDAMGQLFYSISVAMGIMITYGSYVKEETNLVKAVNQIEIFDTVIAFLAGMMIVPAVYTFMGTEGMGAGPSLMFQALPKVFDAMGDVGGIVGTVFFLTVAFAALTSSISIMEAIVSCAMDRLRITRKKATLATALLALVMGLVVCLGYNGLYFELPLPNGTVAQVLDVLDYVSNYLLMPVVAIATCLLVGWVVKPKTVVDEVMRGGVRFGRKWLYVGMVKVVTPVMLLLLLLQSLGIFRA